MHRRTLARPPTGQAVHAADHPEVHEDRVVAAKEGLPRPQSVTSPRGEVVRVGDHDLPAVGHGRVLEPAGLRRPRHHRVPAAREDLVVVAGRDPIGAAREQGIPRASAKPASTLPPPEDSFATSHRTLGRS